MNIVIPDEIKGIPEKYLDQIREMGGVVWNDTPKYSKDIIARIKDAEVITADYLDITPKIIDGAPNLKYIVVPAVGYEWVDLDYAKKKGIVVVNCPDFVALDVAEHTMAILLSLIKRIPEKTSSLKNSKWEQNVFLGARLAGKVLGLVGHGKIAKYLENMLSGFNMEVRWTDSKSSVEDLDRLVSESDIVCLCLPLNSKTKHLFNADRLALLKKTAYLVNVSRRAIIDQEALLESLKNGDLAGAALDVFEGEPLDGVPSEQIVKLASLPNVVATPHSPYTPETIENKGNEIVDMIRRCSLGKPINIVN